MEMFAVALNFDLKKNIPYVYSDFGQTICKVCMFDFDGIVFMEVNL